MDLSNETVYNLIWPFPHCEDCNSHTSVDPWNTWSRFQQYSFMQALFQSPASRVTNIVSDECIIKSMMKFYGLTGRDWETGGDSSHVDWSRQTAGHPGAYTKLMLQRGPDVVRKVCSRSLFPSCLYWCCAMTHHYSQCGSPWYEALPATPLV